MALLYAHLPATARGDAPEQPQSAPQSQENRVEATSGAQAASADTPFHFLDDNWPNPSQCAVRFGYWGTQTSGSPVKVGEYQDLGASPFYDIDGLSTDGRRTVNYTITGTDAETNAVNLNYYQPGAEANINFQRFPHDLGHENLGEFPANTVDAPTFKQGYQFREQDLDPGEDSAIRVQELKANFKWKVNDVLKVRLDLWGFHKEGERQVDAMQECYNAYDGHPSVTPAPTAPTNCHVLTQMQHIDWLTTEVTPAIELKLGPVVAEYSHLIRQFTANDEDVYRWYQSSVTSLFPAGQYMQDGVVPDSTTQTDRLKLSADLNDNNKIYSFLFLGNTRASDTVLSTGALPLQPEGEQVVNQQFSGADVRWTNTSIKNVTLTAYGRTVAQNNEPQATLISEENIHNPLDITDITPIDTNHGAF